MEPAKPGSRIALQDTQVDVERIAWLAGRNSLEMSCLGHFTGYQFFCFSRTGSFASLAVYGTLFLESIGTMTDDKSPWKLVAL